MNAYSERLKLHGQAERRANRRDFDLRYGNVRRHPYGVVARRRRDKRSTWMIILDELTTAVLLGLFAFIIVASA